MQRKVWTRLVLLLSLVVPLTTATAESADAGETLQIVALGDSYTSGTGALDYEDRNCYRSANAYVHRYAHALRQKGIDSVSYNYACHGKWTYDVAGQLTAAGDRLRNADMVFMTIGGNDADFQKLVVNCLAITRYATFCHDDIERVRSLLDGIEYRVRNLLFDINRVAPHAQIVLVGYPFLVDDCHDEYNIVRSLQSGVDIRYANMVSSLNQIPLATAGRVNYASMLSAFSGHEVCGDKAQFIRGTLDTLDIPSEYWHPNREGHQHIANTLISVGIHQKVVTSPVPPSGQYVYGNLPLACDTNVIRATTYDTYNYNGTVFRHGYAIDLPVKDGTPVVAPASGTVYVKWEPYGYGRYLDLVDASGMVHRMAHMREQVSVSNGQKVIKGQQLGMVGVTGATTGPHLHYEQRVGTQAVPVTLEGPALAWSMPYTTDGDRYTTHSLKSGNCGTAIGDSVLIHLAPEGQIRSVSPHGTTTTRLSGIMTPNYRVSCDRNGDGIDEVYSAEKRGGAWYLMKMQISGGKASWMELRRDFFGREIHGLSCGDRDGNGKDEVKVHLMPGGLIVAVAQTVHTTLVTGIGPPTARVECDVDGDGRDEIISLEPAGDRKWRLMEANFNSSGSFVSWSRHIPDGRLSGHQFAGLSCGDRDGNGRVEAKLFSQHYHTLFRVSQDGNIADRALWPLWKGLTTPSFMIECDSDSDGTDEFYSVEDRAEGLFIMQGVWGKDSSPHSWRVYTTDFSGKKITHMTCGMFDL